MKIKSILPFFLTACAIIAAFLLGSKGQLFRQQVGLEKEPLFPELTIEKADYLEASKAGERQIFLKEKGEWQEKEATVSANQESFSQTLQTISSLKRDQLVSENPAKREIFQVGKQAIEVILKSGQQTLAHFYIGKRGQDFLSNFYRKEGEDKVYLSTEVLDTIFDLP